MIEIRDWRDGRVIVHDEGAETIAQALTRAVSAGVVLDYASLVGARLDYASLVGAILDGASLDGARLVGASLVGARLDYARLDYARLVGAILDGASLVGASLVGAILVGAILDGAILDGARLVGAILDGARLDGAILVGARLDGAYVMRGGERVELLRWLGSGWMLAYGWSAFLTTAGLMFRYGCEQLTLADWREHMSALCAKHVPVQERVYEQHLTALLDHIERLAGLEV